MKRATRLAEIATQLGVSASTVSRALRHPEMVREETRVEIIRAAAKAGYEATAAGPARARTGSIGLLLPDLENPFFTTLARAAMNAARSEGYSLVVADSEEDPLGEGEIVSMTHSHVDGLILASSRLHDEDLGRVASASPLLLINRELAGVPSLLIDNSPGVNQAVEHLSALGHRSIAYVEGPPSSWSNIQRRETFLEATTLHQIEGILLGPYPPRFEGGMQAADVAIAKSVTAVIAYNDIMAFGVLSRLSGRGVEVPAAMSVIGFDDAPIAALWSPSLTTITASTAAIGKAAVINLIRMLEDKPIHPEHRRRLPSHLVIRESTGTSAR